MARYSVHLGANYAGTSAELAGCIADAEDWQEAAQNLGYVTSIHREPSRTTILGALTDAVGRLRYRDRLLLTFSGHGSWQADQDGDEADRRDEVIVPADYRKSGVITDDELAGVFGLVPFGARVVFVSDSCHSGTVSRLAFDTTRGNTWTRQPRFLPPAEAGIVDDPARYQQAAVLPARGVPRPSRVALLSGCRDDEVSYDARIDGRARGAASWAYLTALEQVGPAASLKVWHTRAAQVIAERFPEQHPQLYASAWQQRVWSL